MSAAGAMAQQCAGSVSAVICGGGSMQTVEGYVAVLSYVWLHGLWSALSV